jgi:outer membrane translocation and assembly module TamA
MYLNIDFHNKHYFTNLVVDNAWEDHEQDGRINFNLEVANNGPNFNWK